LVGGGCWGGVGGGGAAPPPPPPLLAVSVWALASGECGENVESFCTRGRSA